MVYKSSLKWYSLVLKAVKYIGITRTYLWTRISSLGTRLPVAGHISNKAFVSRNQVSGNSKFLRKEWGKESSSVCRTHHNGLKRTSWNQTLEKPIQQSSPHQRLTVANRIPVSRINRDQPLVTLLQHISEPGFRYQDIWEPSFHISEPSFRYQDKTFQELFKGNPECHGQGP